MPNFKTREDAESWLKTLQPQEAVLIAIRAALRVLPVFATNEQKDMPNLLLPIFRAASATMYFSISPDSVERIINDMAKNGDGFIFEDIRNSLDAVVADDTFSRAVTDAVKAATEAADLITNDVKFPFTSATYAGHAIAAVRIADTIDIDGSIEADANALSKGAAVEELAAMPLWPDGKTPEAITTHWGNLKRRLGHWRVWTEWYDARLKGAPIDKKLEEACIRLPNADWKEGPAHVNAKIKQLIGQHR